MRESIKKAHEKNIPIYAECGGLMYLGEKLVDQNENEYDMVGILKGTSKMTKSLKKVWILLRNCQRRYNLIKCRRSNKRT